jgi:hypothetical protein
MFDYGRRGIDLVKILNHFNLRGCFLQKIKGELAPHTIFTLPVFGLVGFAICEENFVILACVH